MSLKILGRTTEQQQLSTWLTYNRPEFIAIYGRRRVGKTFLIKQYFSAQKCLFFSVTGLQNGSLQDQLVVFTQEISRAFYHGAPIRPARNWLDAFQLLFDTLEKLAQKKQKIVLFFDEFPWMVTHRSKLLTALEYFWNQHWSLDPRIKLIICGSSASWIINKIINNKGGLHNRITGQLQLMPFKLKDCQAFLKGNGINLKQQQVLQLYLLTGGIPYYLAMAQKGLSATQLIDKLAFQKNSLLFTEFDNLFASLFSDPEPYIEMIREIAKHRYGISQEALIKQLKTSRGGRFNQRLAELEQAGFILSFLPHFHKKRGIYYKVIDEYSLFYLHWIEPVRKRLQKIALDGNYWQNQQNTPAWHSWAGYAFEAVCYKHLKEIRSALTINPNAIASTWHYSAKAQEGEQGAQIDLLFDRLDDAITFCEIKYTEKPFVIDKQCARNLLAKQEIFKQKTKTKKQLFMALISANGLKTNLYADDLISAVVTLTDLFSNG